MAKGAQEFEREFITTAAARTGHDLHSWMAIIGAAGLDKTNAIINWLKQDHGLNHMQASILAGIYLNNGQPVHDYDVLFARLFEGKEDQRPLYDVLAQRIKDALSDVEFIPTKTYVSLEHERVFGCIKINRGNLRVGLDLGDRPFDAYVQQAKGLGAMPNIGHMIEIARIEDVTDELVGYVAQAAERTRPK